MKTGRGVKGIGIRFDALENFDWAQKTVTPGKNKREVQISCNIILHGAQIAHDHGEECLFVTQPLIPSSNLNAEKVFYKDFL